HWRRRRISSNGFVAMLGRLVAYAADLAVGVDINVIGHGVGDYFGAMLFRQINMIGGVVFGLNRTHRNAGGIAAALRPILKTADRVARLRIGNDLDAVFGGRRLDDLVTGGDGNGRHGKAAAAWRAGIFGVVTGDAHGVFGVDIPGLELVVGERPVHAPAEACLHFEVAGQQARTGAQPVPGGAADAALVIAAEFAFAGLHIIMAEVGGSRLRRP